MAVEYRLSYTGEQINEKLKNIDDNTSSIEKISADIDSVATNVNEHINNNDTHFSVSEKEKLSGIEENANNYTLPSAGESLGGVKSGGDVTISEGVITVNEHNHSTEEVDGLQTALDSKAEIEHGHDEISDEFIEELFVATEEGEIINTISPISDETIDEIWNSI